LFANEIQIFSSFNKKIELNKESTFKKIYYGSAEKFYANPSKYLSKKDLKRTATYGLESVETGIKSISAGGNGKGGLIGLASVVVVSIGKAGYNWIVKDNEYLYISLITNSKGEQALCYTLIVANDSISKSEGETLALTDQKKYIKGK